MLNYKTLKNRCISFSIICSKYAYPIILKAQIVSLFPYNIYQFICGPFRKLDFLRENCPIGDLAAWDEISKCKEVQNPTRPDLPNNLYAERGRLKYRPKTPTVTCDSGKTWAPVVTLTHTVRGWGGYTSFKWEKIGGKNWLRQKEKILTVWRGNLKFCEYFKFDKWINKQYNDEVFLFL